MFRIQYPCRCAHPTSQTQQFNMLSRAEQGAAEVRVAMELLEMDLEEVMEFVMEFCETALKQIARSEVLTKGAQQTDVEELARMFHTMYGGSAMLGLQMVSQEAHDLDRALMKERYPNDPCQRRLGGQVKNHCPNSKCRLYHECTDRPNSARVVPSCLALTTGSVIHTDSCSILLCVVPGI